MLSKPEISRYSRQLLLPEIGYDGQEKLKSARILVVGAGGLGCAVLPALASAGVGVIGVIDFDTVEQHNLQRQFLFTGRDVGRPKAIAARERLELMNPYVQIEALMIVSRETMPNRSPGDTISLLIVLTTWKHATS